MQALFGLFFHKGMTLSCDKAMCWIQSAIEKALLAFISICKTSWNFDNDCHYMHDILFQFGHFLGYHFISVLFSLLSIFTYDRTEYSENRVNKSISDNTFSWKEFCKSLTVYTKNYYLKSGHNVFIRHVRLIEQFELRRKRWHQKVYIYYTKLTIKSL